MIQRTSTLCGRYHSVYEPRHTAEFTVPAIVLQGNLQLPQNVSHWLGNGFLQPITLMTAITGTSGDVLL